MFPVNNFDSSCKLPLSETIIFGDNSGNYCQYYCDTRGVFRMCELKCKITITEFERSIDVPKLSFVHFQFLFSAGHENYSERNSLSDSLILNCIY